MPACAGPTSNWRWTRQSSPFVPHQYTMNPLKQRRLLKSARTWRPGATALWSSSTIEL